MNKTRAAAAQKIALTFLGLIVMVMAAAQITSAYSIPALFGNTADTAHVSNESQTASGSFQTDWRHTKNGWQNRLDWQTPAPVSKPALHPAVVGSLQLLISLAALIGFSTNKQRFA